MKKFIPEILAALGIIGAAALLVQQHLTSSCPIFFHIEEIKSHEAAASFLVVAAVALVIGKYLGKFLA
jgi:uncharacterized membrane protein required for colicin V production